jgi:hypothetical protein
MITISQLIRALIGRVSADRGRIETLTAEKSVLQKQLAAALAGNAGPAKADWDADAVMRSIGQGGVADIVRELNTRGGVADPDLAKAIESGLRVLDRANAVDLLEHVEGEAFGTAEPPAGPLVRRMLDLTPPLIPPSDQTPAATANAEPPPQPPEPGLVPVVPDTTGVEHGKPIGETPREYSHEELIAHYGPLPPGATGWDQASGKAIFPLTAADISKVPRKKIQDVDTSKDGHGEKIESAL